MISFDLKCTGGHVFEIWFRSSDDYERQRAAGQVMCPACGAQDVTKAAMAPAVAAKGNRRGQPSRAQAAPDQHMPDERVRALIHALAETQAKALKESEWVGGDFAERARAIYYGEADHAVIHGTADAREAREMIEEGLPVAPLLVPVIPPDRTN